MTSVMRKTTLGSIGRIFGGGSVAGLSDGELIGRFARDRDEAAFAAIVARHGPMVLASALAVLRDPHDAEDAFQATFLLLARRAGSIREGGSVGGWLRRVARRVAVRANVEAARDRDRARRLGADLASRSSIDPAVAPEDGPAILGEVDRLPDALRLPLVLCDLDGLTRPEAADRLGWTEGTVRGRLARARALLRSRLIRRGLAPDTAPPLAVLPAWVAAASRLAATPAGGPTSASLLASAVARGLVVARVRAVAAVGLALVLVGVGEFIKAGHVVHSTTESIRQNPPAARAVPAPIDHETLVAYSGHVVDPLGRPFAGASVYLDYYRATRGPATSYPPAPRLRATSGPDGRFRFEVAKGDFLPTLIEPWRRAVVVAVAEGFGLGVSDSDEPDSDGDRTIRLAPDDVPLGGRVLDLEGRPIAGVAVRVDEIQAPGGGSLTPWIEGGREGTLTLYQLQSRHLKKEVRGDPVAGPILPAVTGPDGRFRFVGIGRDRVASLTFEGSTIRTLQAWAMTLRGEPVRLHHFFRAADPMVEVYRPSDADYIAAPTRPYEGVVRDKETGEPIAGASIQSYQFADHATGNVRNVRATTDAAGRFRLVGMPRGGGNEVYVIPPDDRPHFPARVALGDAPGLGPVAVEVSLKRGVWLRGRLTDAGTGKPASGGVSYHVAASNPHLADVPGLREISQNGDYTFNTEAEPDGSFRVPALPGPGLVVAEGRSFEYLAADEEEAGIQNRSFVPFVWRTGEALARVDLPEAGDPPPITLSFQPARKVAGTVLDPAGVPLIGARIHGLFPVGSWFGEPKAATFTVVGLRPPRTPAVADVLAAPNLRAVAGRLKPVPPRSLVFRHDGRKLAASLDVRGDEAGPLAVKLEPWAEVTGRLLDADGQPAPGVALRPYLNDKNRGGGGRVDHEPARILTGADGRFRIDGLVPGLAYRLYHEDPSMGVATTTFIPVPAAKPGATTDLGDVR